MSEPILSVVIPTRNRPDTLKVIIDYIMSWSETDFELVVHDNSDDPTEIQITVEKHTADPRLRYFHTNDSLDMIGNSSAAISKASGEYVCFIGDDDGLIPLTVVLCHWLNEHGIDSATFERSFYVWPDLVDAIKSKSDSAGPLHYLKPRNLVQEIVPEKELTRYIKAGVTNIKYIGPFPYNGLVKRQIYAETLAKTGSYFPAPTPDIACAVSAALLSKKHAHISLPFICGGQSNKSAAGLGRRGIHVGEVKDIKSLPSGTHLRWTKALPYFWSGFTINAESAIKTLHAFGRDDLVRTFNFNRNIAACITYLSPEYRKRAFNHAKTCNEPEVSMARVLANIPLIFLLRVKSWAQRRQTTTQHSEHVTIEDALHHVQDDIVTTFPNLLTDGKFGQG